MMLKCDLFFEYKRSFVSVQSEGIMLEKRERDMMKQQLKAFACLGPEMCTV